MELPQYVTFCQRDLPCASFAAFEDMRKSGELCDLTIQGQNQSISAHRVIVAAAVPYFRSLFNSSGAKTGEIAMGDLDPEALQSLIHFAYTSKVKISNENVQSLLVASEFLLVSQVRDACVEFLSERLTVESVVQVSSLARTVNNFSLTENCSCYMRNNFEEFSKSDDFLSFPCSSVKEIISQDDLNVTKEEIVFEAVINWVQSSLVNRHAMLPELLAEIRMIYLPIDYLIKRVASNELVAASKPCSDLIHEVKNYHMLPKETSLFPNLNTVPRKNSTVKFDLNAVCTWKGSVSVHRWNFDSKTWQNLASLEGNNRSVYYASALSNKIYMFLSKTIQTLDVKTLEWKLLEPKHGNMVGTALETFRSKIYCFGSVDKNLSHTVRCFDTEQNIWLRQARMKTDSHFAAAASLEEYIYVMGGLKSYARVSTVEKYNPVTRQWKRVVSMGTARYGHCCSCMNGKIYVCGGWEATGFSLSAEMYDPLTDQWNFVASMKIARRPLSLISHNNKIHALGGALEVETYDAETDQWNSTFRVPEGFECALLVPITNG